MHRTRRAALTLVEITIALAVAFLFTSMMLRLYGQQRDIQNARAIALRQTEIVNAANAYVTANIDRINQAIDAAGGAPIVIPAGRVAAGGAQPTAPNGLTTIQAGGFLPSVFVDTNFYGQHTSLLLRPGALTGSVEGVLMTYGGRAVSDYILGLAMEFMGPSGGYVPSAPLAGQAGNIVGFKGGWTSQIATYTAPTFTPAAGHLAAYITGSSGAQTVGDYLWRTDTGNPEANRMRASIDMGKHDLAHVQQITGGPSPLASAAGEAANAATATETAIHVANTIVPGLTPLADASLAAAPGEYRDANGNQYNYYIRPDGNTRLKTIDPSVVIDQTAWDTTANGGTQQAVGQRNFPTGMRLIDAIPPIVNYASYVVGDNTVIPQPPCGNPSNPDYSKARIFAMPISTLDYVAPTATTTTTLSYQSVPVVTDASLSLSGTDLTLNIVKGSLNNVQGVQSTTLIDAQGVASTVWATANGGNSWLFHSRRMSGVYGSNPLKPDGSSDPNFQAPLATEQPTSFYDNKYPSLSLVQTACYYGN